MNTVLRASGVPFAVAPPIIVVENTTLVTVLGTSVVVVEVAVVVPGAATVLDITMSVEAEGESADGRDGDGDGDVGVVVELVNVLRPCKSSIDDAGIVILLSLLDMLTSGAKMRGGAGGTNATALERGLSLPYIVFVTKIVAVIVLTLVAGAQAAAV